MVVKDGYRFIQGLLPVRMHKDFTELSRKLGQSRSESLRDAIDHYMKEKRMIATKPNLVAVLDRECLELRQRGRLLWGLCPFHSERAPSFCVNQERQRWHCFGSCGGGGDVIDFVMKYKGLSFPEALKYLGILGDREQVKADTQKKQKCKLLKAFNKWCNSYYKELCDIVRLGNQIDSMVTSPEHLKINGLAEMYLQKEMSEYRLSFLAGNDIETKIAIFRGIENEN